MLKLARPSHATIVAYCALFVALGGTAVAASGVLVKKSKQVAKGVITSKHLKNGAGVNFVDLTPAARRKIGTPGPRGPAGPVAGAAGGDLSGTYPNPSVAAGAVTSSKFAPGAKVPDADKLDGLNSSQFVRPGSEGWHLIGAPGEPEFPDEDHSGNPDGICPGFSNVRWGNYGQDYVSAAFFRDPSGIVHLRGLIAGGVMGCSAFRLPPGYVPEERELFPTIAGNQLGRIDIFGNSEATVANRGGVVPRDIGANSFVTLSGISFRCAPSGADGCP